MLSATTPQPLSPIQKAMFRQMTKSLSIPHFGYSDEIILNEASKLRKSINYHLSQAKLPKITMMAFYIKAMSMALEDFPLLNSKLVVQGDVVGLLNRKAHNIGVAMDTPQG